MGEYGDTLWISTINISFNQTTYMRVRLRIHHMRLWRDMDDFLDNLRERR